MPSFNQTQTVSEANTALKGEKQQHKSVSVTNSLWGKSKKYKQKIKTGQNKYKPKKYTTPFRW